jgi:hypothetical protein
VRSPIVAQRNHLVRYGRTIQFHEVYSMGDMPGVFNRNVVVSALIAVSAGETRTSPLE